MQEQCDVCTFRNNLNKIMSTPVDLGNAWTVDACTLGTTMFLDIHQLPEKTFPDADRFQYYGYKSVQASSEQYNALLLPLAFEACVQCTSCMRLHVGTRALAPFSKFTQAYQAISVVQITLCCYTADLRHCAHSKALWMPQVNTLHLSGSG